jgi:hypothetical protein
MNPIAAIFEHFIAKRGSRERTKSDLRFRVLIVTSSESRKRNIMAGVERLCRYTQKRERSTRVLHAYLTATIA